MIRNVLTIEHNEAMTYLIRTVLADKYRLSVADNVFEGMKLLVSKQEVHLIIVDIDYQTKESVDFILHIHSSKLYKKPIIVLCNTQNQKIFDSQLEGIVLFYFIKPFNPIELVQSIKILNDMESLPFPKNHHS